MVTAKLRGLESSEVNTALDIIYGFRLNLSYCNELTKRFGTTKSRMYWLSCGLKTGGIRRSRQELGIFLQKHFTGLTPP